MLWLLLLPFLILKSIIKALFGLVFGAIGLVLGLAFGAVGLVVGLVASLFAIGVALALIAVPLLPVLLVAFLVWLGIKGTRALAAA